MKSYKLLILTSIVVLSSVLFHSCREFMKPENGSATSVKIQIESFRSGSSSHWLKKDMPANANAASIINKGLTKIKSTQSIDEVRMIVLDMSAFSSEESFLSYWANSQQTALWDMTLYDQLYNENTDEYNLVSLLLKSYTGSAYNYKGDYALQIEGNKAKGTLYLNPGLNYIFYAFRSGGTTVSTSETFFVVKESEENILTIGGSIAGLWTGTWTDTANSQKTGTLMLNITQNGDTISGSFTISGIPCFTYGSVRGMYRGSSLDLDLTPSGYSGTISLYTSVSNNKISDIWYAYVYNCQDLPQSARVNLYWGEGSSLMPPTPVLKEPYNNASNISVNLSFVWNKIPSALSYHYQLALNNAFTTLFEEGTLNAQNSTPMFIYSGLSPNTTYYWRVRASNEYGSSAWSGTWSFTTGGITAQLAQPSLNFPVDSDTLLITTPTLTWNSLPNATSYTLQVSTNSSFSSYLFNQSDLKNNSQLITLSPGTRYYYRVNAVNGNGTSAWSNTWSFYISASAASMICDNISSLTYLGKVYHPVAVGNQCWLKENINAGIMISGHTAQSNNSSLEKYCYNDDTANCTLYGGLYEWTEAMQYAASSSGVQGICPTGWHLPDTTEIRTLINYTGANSNQLKAIGQGSGAGAGTNTTGFTALLGGFRHDRTNPLYFNGIGVETDYWSSNGSTSSANTAYLQISGTTAALNLNKDLYHIALAIRCIKN